MSEVDVFTASEKRLRDLAVSFSHLRIKGRGQSLSACYRIWKARGQPPLLTHQGSKFFKVLIVIATVKLTHREATFS